MPRNTAAARVRLRPQDPFDLIRLLARSQSDPRKALAELVQNSLDAQARRVEITWFNEKGRRALRVWDDGTGIFPELEREEALRRIAQTIGHSHKRQLTPVERREQMILGKYGIGLIGFWSVAEVMEIRSRVGGGTSWCLQLFEDKGQAELVRGRAQRLDEEPTYTQITLRHVHEGAVRAIRPARLQAYLASELRGQLLERGAEVEIHDRVARGRAPKEFRVRPQPFLGLPLSDPRELEVPGHEDARVELYLVSSEDGRSGRVALACGGATVLDDIALIDGYELPRPPWSSGKLEGVIDFPELEVAPGTRRGFVPDDAAQAFLASLAGLERLLELRLAEEERRIESARNQSLAREIRRAFRTVVLRLPEYELFDVKAGAREGAREPRASADPGSDADAAGEPSGRAVLPSASTGAGLEAPTEAGDAPEEELESDGELFAPGPLARVSLVPARLRLPPDSLRSVRARALDADGRRVLEPVSYHWQLEGPGALEAEGERATFAAPSCEARSIVRVFAHSGGAGAEAALEIEVLAELAGREKVGGIPEPAPVQAPAEPWRSRVRDGTWEYNEAHPDCRSASETDAGRLRYLIHLFAKEIVLRNFGRPGDSEVLERLVQVLTHLSAASGRGERRKAPG